MATVSSSPTRTQFNLAEAQQRVRHPLERLRGTIRLYVGLEGVATAAIFVILVFWVGLLFDYGAFKAFGIDWVQVLPWSFRLFVLLGLVMALVGILTAKILVRMMGEFRDTALALVLERRFPDRLADRLITAVELADRKKAERYGYSVVMVEQTIHDAAHNVSSLSLDDVFDWKRLYRQGIWIGVLTLVLYLLVGVGFCVADWIPSNSYTGLAGFGQLNEASGLWFERNILLRNTIWPRRAHLEILDFPASGELKVGRDGTPVSLRVRALKWVVADDSSAEGWRALAWKDLLTKPKLLGGTQLQDQTILRQWTARDPEHGLSLDEIEMQLEKPEIHATLPAETQQALRDVFEKLEQQVALPSMRHKMRKLIIPDRVIVKTRGASRVSELSLQKQTDNEYIGQFKDLKETFRFTIYGEDYSTAPRLITVVSPPALASLEIDQFVPAYLYYRMGNDGDSMAIRGKKQRLDRQHLSLYSGDTSRFEVPAGSDIILIAKSDKDLKDVVIPPPRKGVAEVKGDIQKLDSRTFQVRFDNIYPLWERPQWASLAQSGTGAFSRLPPRPERSQLDFYFELTDTDGVKSMRHIIIKPLEDTIPEANVQIEVIRKTPRGYMATAAAMIPFSGKIRDDHGLDKLEYVCTVERADEGASQSAQGLLILSAMHFLPGGPGQDLATVSRLAALMVANRKQKAGTDVVHRFPVPNFTDQLSQLRRRSLPLSAVLDKLDKQLRASPPFNEFTMDPDKDPVESFFNVENLKLKTEGESSIQPTYYVHLWVEATDNDIEMGPHSSTSKEKFMVVIVSENELLAEIGKEEETLYAQLGDATNRVRESSSKLELLGQDLAATKIEPAQFTGMNLRVDELEQQLEKNLGTASEVLTSYQRILKELEINRVSSQMISRVKDSICEPLRDIIVNDFVRTREGLSDLRKTLTADGGDMEEKIVQARKAQTEAAARQLQLLTKLMAVLDAMQGLTNLNKLIEKVRMIEEKQQEQGNVLAQLKKQLQNDLIRRLQGVGSDK